MNLTELGWDVFFQQHFSALGDRNLMPARIAREHRQRYVVLGEFGEQAATIAGRLRHAAEARSALPAVGDWVAVTPMAGGSGMTIHTLLPRKSSFSRKAVLSGGMPDTGGRAEAQVLAANLDTVFLVSALDGDFNLRRIERYLSVAWDGGATPVILLNKIDVCAEVEGLVGQAESIARGVAVHPVSAASGDGIEALQGHLGRGLTVAFLGSSGVGKSSLINRLLGSARLPVGAVRSHDNRGRHTTSVRELVLLPSGGVLIDTPGLREIQMWGDEAALQRTFDDIEHLARACRFRDCRHGSEPGCAVQQAVAEGLLEAGRLRSYRKLRRERQVLAVRQDQRARLGPERRRLRSSRHSVKKPR
jgi:ribosome biogenesis GTPase